MERVAEITGGRFFDAQDTAELRQAMREALAAPYDVLDAADNGMILLAGGTLLVAASLLYLAFKLRVAYGVGAEPENAGGLPTLDGVIFPPVVCACGVWLVAGEMDELRVSAWIAVAIWLLLTVAAAWQ